MNTNLKTIYPKLVEVGYTSSFDLLSRYTSYVNLVSNFTTELKSYLTFYTSQFNGDVVTGTAQQFYLLNTKFKDFDNCFIDEWVQKYNTSLSDIKTAVLSALGTSVNFYTDLSDSIGTVTNSYNYLTDAVLPIYDINVTIQTPVVFNSASLSKIRPNTLSVSNELSRKTTSMFRYNMLNTTGMVNRTSGVLEQKKTTDAHGVNLVTDYNSFNRAKEYTLRLTQKLKEDFDEVFKLVTYYNTINDQTGYSPGDLTKNKQFMSRLTFSQVGNSYTNDLDSLDRADFDLLGKRIKSVRSSLDETISSVLGFGDESTFSTLTSVNVASPLKTQKPLPINSTVSAKTYTNIKNETIKQAATTTAPISIDKESSTLKNQSTSTSQTLSSAKVQLKQDDVNVVKRSQIVISIPSILNLPNDIFRFVSRSPYDHLNTLKDAICNGFKGFNNIDVVNKLFKNNGELAALKNAYTKLRSFSIRDTYVAACTKVKQLVWNTLLSLIPQIPFLNTILAVYQKAKEVAACRHQTKKD